MAGKRVVVAGAGGFIGGHLAAKLSQDGWQVRAVDKKPLDEWFQRASRSMPTRPLWSVRSSRSRLRWSVST